MGFPGTGQLGALDDLNAEKKYESMKVHMTTVAGNEALVHVATQRYPGAAFFFERRPPLPGEEALEALIGELGVGDSGLAVERRRVL